MPEVSTLLKLTKFYEEHKLKPSLHFTNVIAMYVGEDEDLRRRIEKLRDS